jgi:hypothetical protein
MVVVTADLAITPAVALADILVMELMHQLDVKTKLVTQVLAVVVVLAVLVLPFTMAAAVVV